MPGLTQPTAAAMRAVDVRFVGGDSKKLAEYVDRKTGLPELIAACEAASEFLNSSSEGGANAWRMCCHALAIAREGRR